MSEGRRKGPRHPSTSAAELFFLHHLRSCAASAVGAQVGKVGTSAGFGTLPSILRAVPGWLHTVLDGIFAVASRSCLTVV